MSRNITLIVLASLWAVACGPSQEKIANGDDPIAALRSTAQSSRYGAAYWREQLEADSALWKEALTFCADSQRADYPNCQTVRSTEFIGKAGAVENPALSDEGFNP